MSNYATLIASIQSVITENGNNEITGTILQQTLLSMINSLGSGYQFVGVATPETNPGTPDQRVVYLATSGTYPNFGPTTIPAGNLAVLYYDTSWHYSLFETTSKFMSGEDVNEVSIVNDLNTGGAHNVLSAEQGKILGNKLDLGFVDVDNSQFLKNGTINSSGNYTSNTSAKIYWYPIKAGQRIVFYVTASSTAYCVLSFSTLPDPTSFNMIMMYVTNGNYYSYVAPSDGYAFVLIETGASGKVWMVNPQEPQLNEFGVKKYTFGENAVQKYVGSAVTDTSLWGSGFLTSTGSITSGSGYHYTKDYIPVLQGSYIQAGMTFSGNARLCYYDANKTFLSAVSTGNATGSTVRAIPTNAAYMRFCMSNTNTDRLSFIYQNEGKLFVDVAEINTLNNEVSQLKQSMSSVDSSIDNNLLNEFNKTKNWQITADGSTYSDDNYGQPAVRYRIPVDTTQSILHIRFRFQQSNNFVVGTSYNQDICMVGSSSKYHVCLRQNSPNYDASAGILNHRQFYCVLSGSSIDDLTLDDIERKVIRGPIAFTLEYKGTSYSTANSYKLVFTNTYIRILDGSSNTLENFDIASTDLISSVIDTINANSNYLKATFYEVDGVTVGSVLNTGTDGVPLCASTTGSRPWYFCQKIDPTWHTFEAIIDYDNLKSYTNIDGLTIQHTLPNSDHNSYVFIGGLTGSSSYPVTRILARDLHIGYGYEDAEVITYPNNVSGNVTRLISDWSPYLMIFEGHSIDVAMNKDMPTGSTTYMAASTDSLRTVFNHLKKKGFIPVSWKDVVDWKKGKKNIPKRSYTLMFDDFQIENYMYLAKRVPFVQYGVKPGLAIITATDGTTRSRTEQVTIDGQVWTLGEVFDAIERAGWYPCSHTKNHTVMNITNVKDSNLLEFCKECIYSCDKLGIYDDVLVYPTGSTSTFKKNLMTMSGFAIGVQVSVNGYNCKNSLDFNLIRNEIGSRKNINDIIAQIV